MVFNVVIFSPHGYFGQANVLGLPDTGGQVRKHHKRHDIDILSFITESIVESWYIYIWFLNKICVGDIGGVYSGSSSCFGEWDAG